MVTKVQALGNIPAVRNSFFDDKRPDIKLESGQRISYLRFKTDKEKDTLRSSMAVVVNLLTPSSIIHGSDKGTEFLQALVNEAQDSVLKATSEGKADFDTCQDYQKLIADYFDNSRAGGNRVNGEDVGKFFDANLSDWLMGRVIEKFPQFDADKVAKVVSQYRASFMDLAKYQMPHSKPVFSMIDKAWREATMPETADTDMVEWVAARLKKLGDRHNEAEMLIDAI